MRIYIILALVSFFLSACGVVQTSPFGEKSFILIPTSQEVAIGERVAREVERREKICKDEVVDYVEEVGKRIAEVADRKDVQYRFKVICSDVYNAFALPGGWIYIYRGLLKKLENEAELAFVLGREVGHVVARHSIRRLQVAYGINILLSFAFRSGPPSELEAKIINTLLNIVMAGYSRREELEADAIGAYYAGKAGWNPEGAIQALELLDRISKFKPSGITELFMDHPTNQKRIQNLRKLFSTFPDEWFNNPLNEDRYEEMVLRRLNEGSGNRKKSVKRGSESNNGTGRSHRWEF